MALLKADIALIRRAANAVQDYTLAIELTGLASRMNESYEKALAQQLAVTAYDELIHQGLRFTVSLRRDVKKKWLSVDPVLRAYEVVLESDTGLLKVGDGVHVYSELPYWGPLSDR